MSSNQVPAKQAQVSSDVFGLLGAATDYAIDAAQRTVLFWDVMRQRGNQYRQHLAETVPNVLTYEAELIIDGRTFKRPVNYGLVRIVPPKGVTVDPRRRPFVIVDPRAGHGPGIGGFKADSEIGVAFKAGHPCYFVGFLPEPVPGQTIEDIARAEAIFLDKVAALHPDADGKPCVIGNCQGGWAVMMLAAIRPELFGPIIIAGSPLSYWAGVHGKNPMRYSGGLLGGSWLTALTSDLGGGKFDGAWLVQNFENQNPANTLWTKQYNVYSKIDTEAPRYLGFERYWGGHVNLNAEEIQFIVDELFVGNNLAAGRIKTSDGIAVDLRNIRSPIVVFCSKGDKLPYIVVAMLSYVLLVLLAVFLFHVPIKGSFLVLTLGTLLYVGAATGFGQLVSTFTKTQVAAVFATVVISIIPAANFSGVLVPVSSLSGGARLMGLAFPSAWYEPLSVGTFTKGLGFEDLWPKLAVLAAFFLAYGLAAILILRKQEA
ncbi:MAG: DUF3141 domain-containing protein [Deltaproteobacteria bacterium]|nr:DUF3141 domain-containing protein [Deltaproteobacteria bacterium]